MLSRAFFLKLLSFGKIRAAWGQVATANVGAYSSSLTYGLFGQGHLGLPMAAFSGGDNIPNPNLSSGFIDRT